MSTETKKYLEPKPNRPQRIFIEDDSHLTEDQRKVKIKSILDIFKNQYGKKC